MILSDIGNPVLAPFVGRDGIMVAGLHIPKALTDIKRRGFFDSPQKRKGSIGIDDVDKCIFIDPIKQKKNSFFVGIWFVLIIKRFHQFSLSTV